MTGELRLEIIHCHHCTKQHIDHNEYADFNHSRHLCSFCNRFFFTKYANIGVEKP